MLCSAFYNLRVSSPTLNDSLLKANAMPPDDSIKGLPPLPERINIHDELKRLSNDPLSPLIRKLKGEDHFRFYSDELTRYQDAYWFFYLSLERFLPEMGYATRWMKGPLHVRGKGQKYTAGQKRLSQKFHASKKYIEYDLFNCILHSRILMDRVAGVSRSFLKTKQVPSFTSFSDHKKFFVERALRPFEAHEEYARHISEQTDWFDYLKEVRDHFVVHQSPSPYVKHRRYWLGYSPIYHGSG